MQLPLLKNSPCMKIQGGFFVPARDQKSVISETGEGVQAKGEEQMKEKNKSYKPCKSCEKELYSGD